MRKSIVGALLALAAVAAPAWAQEASPPSPLTVDGGLMVWTVVIFVLLFLVLRASAWPQLLGAVREREKRLEQQLADAEKSRAEALALLEEHKKLLAGAQSEAQAIVAKAKVAADKEREVLLAKARDEYDGLLARARKEITDEKEKAVVELRREAIELSIAAASKLIEAKLDAPANRRLVMDYLATIPARQ